MTTRRFPLALLAVPLMVACPLVEPRPDPRPTVSNITDSDIWLSVRVSDTDRLTAQRRVDAGTTGTVAESCTHTEVFVSERRPETVDDPVLFTYDASEQPELCAREHPGAVWVWDGEELRFTER